MDYKVKSYVWSTTKIHVGKVTIPRSTKGCIVGVEGTLNKKYRVVWNGFPGVITTLPKKFIATN